jgi:integrase
MKPRKREGGAYVCQPTVDGKRKLITLGKISKADANEITCEIQRLLEYRKYGLDLPPGSKKWLKSIGPELRKKLSDLGIIDLATSVTFESLLDQFLKAFCDGTRRPNTEDRMERSTRTAREVFGSTLVADITNKQVEEFFRRLKKRFQSTATWTKSLNDTKQVFRWGIERRLIEDNPIALLKGGSMANDARMQYVDPEVIEEVIGIAQPRNENENYDWTLIFALARYAGLRVPSEFFRLRWEDVNWNKETIRIYAPKTKQWRICPIFPPLWRRLTTAWEALPPGTKAKTHVIQVEKRRAMEANLRSQAIDLIERAGQDQWPKIFQNLRMSCATDLLNHYHVQKVATWLGHSVKILLKHYHGSTGTEIQVAKEQIADPFTV